jgi:L-fuconate dehydratase
VWKLLADATRQLVSCIDFTSPTLTPDAALDLLEATPRPRAIAKELMRSGYPAYTTSVSWMGYPDGTSARCRAAVADGWTHFKVKVGGPPDDDARRLRLVREEIGPGRTLMIDAIGSGTSTRRRASLNWRRSNRGGSRSRPARTTCWSMRGL